MYYFGSKSNSGDLETQTLNTNQGWGLLRFTGAPTRHQLISPYIWARDPPPQRMHSSYLPITLLFLASSQQSWEFLPQVAFLLLYINLQIWILRIRSVLRTWRTANPLLPVYSWLTAFGNRTHDLVTKELDAFCNPRQGQSWNDRRTTTYKSQHQHLGNPSPLQSQSMRGGLDDSNISL